MNNETEQIFIINTGQGPSSTLLQKQVDVEMPGTTHTSLENVEDFSNVCRTCATITEFVIPIFAGEGLQNNLAEKIHKHLPIKVCEADVLPRVVCYQCASTLLAWHELVQCCVQADAALRARALQPIQESKCTNPEPTSTLQEDTESKFAIIPEYPSSAEPPQYEAEHPRTRRTKARPCPFCAMQLEPAEYQKHLILEHSELLFICEECDDYIDRKDFMVHMSAHAAEYKAGRKIKREPQEPRRRVTRKRREESEREQNQNTRELAPPAANEPAPGQKLVSSKEKQTNEFSDHSDTESEFGPLPESVFEAIEDSQDSQPAEEDATCSPDDRASEAHSSASEDDSSEYAGGAHDVSHTKASKTNAKPKPRTCPICAKEYRASSSYFYHMKHAHQRSREHECDVCGRGFGTRAALAQHAPLHTGESRFECEVCHKRFRSNAGLYIHAQTHGAHKAWSCAQCGRAFRWRAQLRRHAQRHAPARAHACAACGRAFRVRCDLLRHERTHAAGAHACRTCGQSFAQLRYLKVHIKKKH